ncbi:hypothetical protein BsWGS_04551 [Bradybaena similaris]
MNLTPDRQGYLGELKDRTTAELKELLERQEKILSKRTFLEKLPDKGEKTKAFAVYLKQLIQERSIGLPSSTVFAECGMGHFSNVFPRTISVKSDNHYFSDKDQPDPAVQNNAINDQSPTTENREGSSDNSIVDGSSNLVLSLEKMSIGGSSNQVKQPDTEHYINSYERVIKQAESKSTHRKQKFLPNRTLLHDTIPPSPYPHDTAAKKPEREEESAAHPPCYKFQKSQLIPIEESVKLIEQQKALNEELTTQRVARKLADQLLPKMDIYSPASADMQYRETGDADQDSDDEDDNDGSDTDVD